MQVHVNIVAVAVLKELSAILLVQGREPDPETLARAVEQHVTILIGPLSGIQGVRGAVSASEWCRRREPPPDQSGPARPHVPLAMRRPGHVAAEHHRPGAARSGLDMLAICDHNSAENACAVIRAAAARRSGRSARAGDLFAGRGPRAGDLRTSRRRVDHAVHGVRSPRGTEHAGDLRGPAGRRATMTRSCASRTACSSARPTWGSSGSSGRSIGSGGWRSLPTSIGRRSA